MTDTAFSMARGLVTHPSATDVIISFLLIVRNFTSTPKDAFPQVKAWERQSHWKIKLPWICTKCVTFKMSLCPCLPPLAVLRQWVSSTAYLSVLYSSPPLRQRTRVYYSLQKPATPKEHKVIPHGLKTTYVPVHTKPTGSVGFQSILKENNITNISALVALWQDGSCVCDTQNWWQFVIFFSCEF